MAGGLMDKLKKDRWDSIFLTIGLLLLGLVLLIWPAQSATIVVYLLGAILTVFGIYHIIHYCIGSHLEAMNSQELAIGLLFTASGLSLIIWPGILMNILPTVCGCVLVISGFVKLQSAFDMQRMHYSLWYLGLIGAAVSIILGVISICDPFAMTAALFMFMGISLLVDSIMDIVLMIKFKKLKKAFFVELDKRSSVQ